MGMVTYEKLFVGAQCNNYCAACPTGDKERSLGLNELIGHIDALAEPENIQFHGGEPTLRSDLLSLVSYARKRGGRRIKLVTNGRRLAEWDLLSRLVEEGCRLFEVKINGSRPETHEALTGAQGSFEQTMQGLHNLRTLSNSPQCENGLFVAVRVAVTRANLGDLAPIVGLLLPFGVDRIIFDRRGADFHLAEGAQILGNVMKMATLNRVWSVCEGFPPCLMKGCERHVAELLAPSLQQAKKPKGCNKCDYADICTGPPKDYAGPKGSAGGFKSVSGSAYIEDVNRLFSRGPVHGQ